MPEIVEAQMLVDGLQPLRGQTLIDVERIGDSKIISDETILRLSGKKILYISRIGKRPVIEFEDRIILEVFLSMTGTFGLSIEPKYPRLKFILDEDILYYADMRKWGKMKIITDTEYVQSKELYIADALDSSTDELFDALKSAPVAQSYSAKDLLMDQSVIIGLGNIYSQEILYDAGIRPDRAISDLTSVDRYTIARYIRQHIDRAYELGGLSVSNYTHVDGKLGRASELNNVYRRKECKVCDTKIIKIEQWGRSTYYCPHCQK